MSRHVSLYTGLTLVVLGMLALALHFQLEREGLASLSWLGGLLVAAGAVAIGIGMGRWWRPPPDVPRSTGSD
jgi:hypothetical protein